MFRRLQHDVSRRTRTATLACVAAWVALLPVAAETLRYEFEIGDHQEAKFVIPFDVIHAGRVGTEVSWKGSRILSFRLEGPGSPPIRVVRSGPSPQRIQATATEDGVAAGREWRMFIRALPARGAAIATLVVETPEPAPPRAEIAPPADPPPSPSAPTEPWTLPRAAPASASDAERAVFEAVEAFRSIVVTASGELRPDPCSWQGLFLQFAARLRDAAAATPSTPGVSAHPCARRFTVVLDRIEWLRTTDDPEIRGGAPEDPDERIAWKARRDSKVRPVEQDLDQIFAMLRGARCPDLAGEIWPSRLLACATSCQRHFEERARLGEDAVASADFAREEWPALLAASAVLEAIVARGRATESARVP